MTDKILVVHFFGIFLSVVFSYLTIISIKHATTLVWYVSMGYILPKVLDLSRNEWKKAFSFFIIGTFLLSLWVLFNHVRLGIFYEVSYKVGRPFIGHAHTNLSVLIEPVLIVCVGLIYFYPKKWPLISVLAIIFLAVIEYSCSRTSYITTSIALIGFAILIKKNNFRIRLLSTYLFAITLLTGIWWLHDEIHYKTTYQGDLDRYGNPIEESELKSWDNQIQSDTLKTASSKNKDTTLVTGDENIAKDSTKESITKEKAKIIEYSSVDKRTFKRTSMIEELGAITDFEYNPSNGERKNRWINGLKMYSERPLTGIGVGNFPDLYLMEIEKKNIAKKFTISDFRMNIHSLYLSWLVEGGIFTFISGMLLFFLIIIYFLRMIAVRKLNVLKIMLGLYFFVFFTHNIVQDFSNEPRVIIPFWIALFLISNQLKFSIKGRSRKAS